jgi:hypothetical protein
LVYIPAKKNIQADSLSQQPDLCPQEIDNKDVIVLPEHLFVNPIDMKSQKKIVDAKNMDYDTAEAIKELCANQCGTPKEKIPRSSNSRTSRRTPNI